MTNFIIVLMGEGITAGIMVLKLEFILKLKIKCKDWLLADKCPDMCSQAANHCTLF